MFIHITKHYDNPLYQVTFENLLNTYLVSSIGCKICNILGWWSWVNKRTSRFNTLVTISRLRGLWSLSAIDLSNKNTEHGWNEKKKQKVPFE